MNVAEMRKSVWLMMVVVVFACSTSHADTIDNDRASAKASGNPNQADENSSAAKEHLAGDAARKKPSGRFKSEEQKDEGKGKLDERRILDFIGKHQSELSKLLTFLRENQPDQYQQALKEMSRSQQRLENLQKRDTELFEIELELWKIKSRIRLIAAEIMVAEEGKNKQVLEEVLRGLIGQEIAQDLARLTLQRRRAVRQLDKLTAEIARRTNTSEELSAKALELWQSRIAKQTPRNKNNEDKKNKDDNNAGKNKENSK